VDIYSENEISSDESNDVDEIVKKNQKALFFSKLVITKLKKNVQQCKINNVKAQNYRLKIVFKNLIDRIYHLIREKDCKHDSECSSSSTSLSEFENIILARGQEQLKINALTKKNTLVPKIRKSMSIKRDPSKKTSYQIQNELYLKKKCKLDKKWNDLYSIQKIQEDLTNDRIKIVKYNYALEK
jgi:hypothetical protein